jgi:hypothetical protein
MRTHGNHTEIVPTRPRSGGSLVQVDGDYLFFTDGGRSAPSSLANQWKRPSTTRGSSYAQFASMLHIGAFSDQLEELGEAMQQKGVVTNLDRQHTLWHSPDSASTVASERPQSVGLGQLQGEPEVADDEASRTHPAHTSHTRASGWL